MGDRTWTSIEFSGEISETQGAELVDLLEAQGCENNTNEGVNLTALAAGDSFYDDCCNYGNMDEIEEWCPLNDVSYLKTWAAGGDYGPGMELYDAASRREYHCAAIESSPALGLAEVIALKLAGRLDERIAELRRLDSFSQHYPALKVLKVEDWTDELCKFMAERALLEEA